MYIMFTYHRIGGRDMNTWIWILELIGTVAFSVSGAVTGVKKHMDIFGVAILGLTTAVGGGVLRDLILGVTPPVTFRDPVYALVAIGTAVFVFLPTIRARLTRSGAITDSVLLLMDSLGLGIFTVVGIKTAVGAIPDPGVFLLIFVGAVTGVGGGVLRDVLAGDTPYIFVKHIYACASVAGAILCVVLWNLSPLWAMLSGTALVVVIRLLSARFKWNLPRA